MTSPPFLSSTVFLLFHINSFSSAPRNIVMQDYCLKISEVISIEFLPQQLPDLPYSSNKTIQEYFSFINQKQKSKKFTHTLPIFSHLSCSVLFHNTNSSLPLLLTPPLELFSMEKLKFSTMQLTLVSPNNLSSLFM